MKFKKLLLSKFVVCLKKQVVCLMTLKEGYFMQAAIDNLNHGPTSSTAKESFHRTGISGFQYMNEREIPTVFHTPYTTNPSLPDSYTEILPTKGGKREPDQYPDQPLPNVISENAKDGLCAWKMHQREMNKETVFHFQHSFHQQRTSKPSKQHQHYCLC